MSGAPSAVTETSMAQWTLRAAREEDVDELLSLETACFGEPWNAATLQQALADPKYCVLCAHEVLASSPVPNPRLVGYALAWSVWGESQLDRLAVLPEWRRCGVGRALLDAMVGALWQAGAGVVFLEVRAGNGSALALYERAHFEIAGRRRAYYEDGEDALLLRRTLP